MLVGIDEVGRGCWAGPLVAAAVMLPQTSQLKLKDSKQLTKQQREKLNAAIRIEALSIGVGWVSAQEIDEFGLTQAVRMAMKHALESITAPYERVVIDGNFNFLSDDPKSEVLIGADAKVPAVSAASIIAKVARDQFMTAAAQKYGNYGFEKHVGYGTALHMEQLRLHGVCELHRRSCKPVRAILSRATEIH